MDSEHSDGIVISTLTDPGEVDAALLGELVRCWADVSDAGGAVGFAHSPVDRGEVRAMTEELVAGLDAEHLPLFVARGGERVAGWVALSRDRAPMTAHWGLVKRLQSHPDFRGLRIGERLLDVLSAYARGLGLRHLHLTARGGLGLEGYYGRMGWKEVGRWPASLAVGPGELRDEILMQYLL